MALALYDDQDLDGRWRASFYEVAQATFDRDGFKGFVEVVPKCRGQSMEFR
ncbi:MAG: hypothetical protein JKY27_08300 [Magnetovibrio sp.]|nr:hypothetical protein [Magnetovibrio sp.]